MKELLGDFLESLLLVSLAPPMWCIDALFLTLAIIAGVRGEQANVFIPLGAMLFLHLVLALAFLPTVRN